MLGITRGAITQACRDGRLEASQTPKGQWSISLPSLQKYRPRSPSVPRVVIPGSKRHREYVTRLEQEAIDAAPYLAAVCTVCHVSMADLLGAGRILELVSARRVAIYLLLRDGGFGPTAIGRQLHSDHTTILHAEREIRRHLTSEQRWEIAECRHIIASATEPQQQTG